jgi:hypothetical protein
LPNAEEVATTVGMLAHIAIGVVALRIVAVSDFSGLASSACALAKAEASAATDSLDRGMDGLRRQDVKAHRARFRALPAHAMPDRLLGVLRHQGLELAFGPLVFNKGWRKSLTANPSTTGFPMDC